MIGDTIPKLKYTTYWATECPKTIVFDINYRLAPDNLFPDGLCDCWESYTWIINNAKHEFGIDYKNVILTGDSAGGNLITAVTAMAIERGFRVPDFIMPIFPLNVCNF